MIRPPRLRRGDMVRVVAPGSHFDRERFNRGVRVLEQDLGFRVRWRDDLFTQQRFLAGDDSRRAAELHEAFSDPDTRGIFCARGGYGSARLINRLDPTIFRDNPKILIGFSDITALLNWIYTIANLVTFHGPMVTGLMSEGLSAPDLASLERTLMMATPAGALNGTRGRTLVAGVAQGRLVGGSLAMLAAGAGTPYLPPTDGAIVFLEDVREKPFRLDRMLRQLLYAGFFDSVAGVALGEFVGCENPADPENGSEDILRDFCEELGVPAVIGLPFGHGDANRTIPIGVEARLDADAGELSITEPAVI